MLNSALNSTTIYVLVIDAVLNYFIFRTCTLNGLF